MNLNDLVTLICQDVEQEEFLTLPSSSDQSSGNVKNFYSGRNSEEDDKNYNDDSQELNNNFSLCGEINLIHYPQFPYSFDRNEGRNQTICVSQGDNLNSENYNLPLYQDMILNECEDKFSQNSEQFQEIFQTRFWHKETSKFKLDIYSDEFLI